MTILAFVCLTTSAAAQSSDSAASGQAAGVPALFPPAAVHWKQGPAALKPGAEMVVLEGDPARAGVFTMRLRLPDGFEVAPHWHTQVEHVTVISGVLHFGMGQRFDRTATRPMPAGS
ncbi:MAG TPA: cupin domain-containing protein, partial [Gemmatimonadales bacterium]|nr:cupin domain-containing protein [Gemmatimonadales bacterium]